jgi:acyl-homoserine lactone acylase PvdQ
MKHIVICLLAFALAACTQAPAQTTRTYAPTITRDAYGVPSVHGRDDAEAAYGIGYAHAEDNFATIQLVVLAARGKLGAHLGEEGARSDFLWHLLGVRESVASRYESDLSPEFRAILDGYAAGLNAYASEHPEEVLPGARNVTGTDVAAGSALTLPLFWGFERVLGVVTDKQSHPCRVQEATAESVDRGSNAFAVSPSRSDDGHTRLIVNSHQPWAGPVAWYEAGVSSDSGWRMYGGLFPGSPFPVLGTNGRIGFAATVNLPDLADIYRLTTDRAHPGHYFYNGEWRPFVQRTIWLGVKLGPIVAPIPRTLRFTVHGPAFQTADGWVAVRYAGAGEIRALEQFWRMGRAQDYDAWRAAMAMRAIPSFNFIYADASGQIAYHYNAILPRRDPARDWSGCVPGDSSETLWTQGDWIEAPVLAAPRSGWLYSTNGAPWSATDASADLRAEDHPDAAPFIETYITNRGYRAVEILSPLARISDRQLLDAKFDVQHSTRSRMAEAVNAVLASNDPALAEAQAVLRVWNLRADAENTSAALALLMFEPLYTARRLGQPEPSPLVTVRSAAEHLRTHFGRLDLPLGEVLRLRRGAVDLPLEGAPDVLRALRWTADEDGRLNADFGDGFMMVMDWTPDGSLSARVISQWGASERPDSPHYADQSPLFARREWRSVE